MEISIPQDQTAWDQWITQNAPHSPFPQSWEWGEILRSEGKKIDRFVFSDNDRIVAQVQLIQRYLPGHFGFSFAPKGPVLSRNYTGGILSNFRDFLVKNKVIFVRVEPRYELINMPMPVVPVTDVNPRVTVILDLHADLDKILAEMHTKTRYNIHLSQRKNLRVSEWVNENDFWKLMSMTAQRDGFRTHDRGHYLAVLGSASTRQITIYEGDRPIAVGVFFGYGDTFTYLYGASDYDCRASMAPYLIQWEGIKLGKKLGFKYYDFFGIAPGRRDAMGEYVYDQHHSYSGITKFKLGFGGDISFVPGTVDILVSRKLYRLYRALRWLRRLI